MNSFLDIFFSISLLIQQIGLSLAVGSSTYAIAFYLKATADGVINDTERDFMHTVYFVLRIGMGLIIAGEILRISTMVWVGESFATILTPVSLFVWMLLCIIVLNAVLMHHRRMPMTIGPAIAGGSWYMMLIADTLKKSSISFIEWTLLYIIFIGGFALLLRVLKKMTSFTPSVSS